MIRPDGGHAFPTNDYDKHGMTLRDYFAGQALAMSGAMLSIKGAGVVTWSAEEILASAAEVAYRMADAMLVERAK